MEHLEDIRKIKEVQESDFLNRPGVTGVDIGYKYVSGKKTDQLAIRVYVSEKKKDTFVPEAEMIPEAAEGIPTDVIERTFVLDQRTMLETDLVPQADVVTYDPLKGGISIGPCRIIGGYVFVGTLGAIVREAGSNKPMLLSNYHVMCVDTNWSVGDTMAQPARNDGGTCPSDIVGTLHHGVLAGSTSGSGPGVDCAITELTARGHLQEIVGIGEITGTAAATPGMAVRKRGRTTELTYGTVDTVDLSAKVSYGHGIGDVTLTRQIGVDVDTSQSTIYSAGGDSGAVVVTSAGRVVGLHYAGGSGGAYGVANPIGAVTGALGVSFYFYVGNRRTKELHRFSCYWVGQMSGHNKRYFTTVNQALSQGYNGCYYCLRSHDTG